MDNTKENIIKSPLVSTMKKTKENIFSTFGKKKNSLSDSESKFCNKNNSNSKSNFSFAKNIFAIKSNSKKNEYYSDSNFTKLHKVNFQSKEKDIDKCNFLLFIFQ